MGTQSTRLPEAIAAQLGQETGLLLVSVEPDSPAERGRLYLGDTIVSLDQQPVRHLDDLFALLGGDQVGKSMSVRILRGGQIHELTITIGERS